MYPQQEFVLTIKEWKEWILFLIMGWSLLVKFWVRVPVISKLILTGLSQSLWSQRRDNVYNNEWNVE